MKKEYICRYQSPLGAITLASNGRAITGLWFDGQKYDRDTLTAGYEEKALPVFDEAVRWLDCYFRGEVPDFTPLLAPDGSPFRLEVWEILKKIPYGKTMTYGGIAKELARKRGLPRMSAQAVGGAVGHNPISLIIPCHRVVGADGSLTGYSGGIEKKVALLELEEVNMETLFVPKRGTAL